MLLFYMNHYFQKVIKVNAINLLSAFNLRKSPRIRNKIFFLSNLRKLANSTNILFCSYIAL